MSDADDFKKLRDAVLAQGIEDPDGDARLVFTPAAEGPPQWKHGGADPEPCSYLVTYAAQGTRWWSVMSPLPGYGIDHVLNSALLSGDDVSHVRITRLALNPHHKHT
jgi:hypothetical protein